MISDPFRRAQVAVAALFFFLGFQYVSWVSRIPAFTAEFDLSPGQVGLLLMMAGIGATVSLPLVNYLMRRLGSRRLAGVSAAALIAVLLAMALSGSYPLTMLVVFCDGLAVGCLNVAMNAQASALEATYRRNTMARMHAAFSCGLLAAALVTSAVTAVSEALVPHFGIAAMILGLLLALALSGALPESAASAASAASAVSSVSAGEPAVRARRRRLPALVAVWLSVALVFGEITEGTMNDWSALYLKEVAGASPSVTPLGIAVVSATMLLARLFADGWRSRWGDQRVVMAGSALAGCGLAGALLAGGVVPTLAGFAVVGLGMAAVTPCIYAAAARLGSEVLALVATMGTVGLLAGPPAIGFIAERTSLTGGMATAAVLALLVAACASRIAWQPALTPAAPDPAVASSDPAVASLDPAVAAPDPAVGAVSPDRQPEGRDPVAGGTPRGNVSALP